ncbi:MAG: hypothetical protein JST39_24945 [Bacteroidetes bacterium]|nr:hypothetical protein [Bacteroidota bacterium]
MKRLFIFMIIVAGSFAFSAAQAQVRVSAHIGVNEREYPGYQYYSYPAWRGHYHDRYYYQHYRPAFERQHRGYFRGRRFDHDRFKRDYRHEGRQWRRRQ